MSKKRHQQHRPALSHASRNDIIKWLKTPYDVFIQGPGRSLDFANAFVDGKQKFIDGICCEIAKTNLDNLVFFGDSVISRMHQSIKQEQSVILTILGKVQMPKTDVVLRLSDTSSIEKAVTSLLPDGKTATVSRRVSKIGDEVYGFGYLDFSEMVKCVMDGELPSDAVRLDETPAPDLPMALNIIIRGTVEEDIYDAIEKTLIGHKFPISHETDGETVTSMFQPLHIGFPVSVRYDNPFYLEVHEFKDFLKGLVAWNEPFTLETKWFDSDDMKSIVFNATFKDGRQEFFASRPTTHHKTIGLLLSRILDADENVGKLRVSSFETSGAEA